MAPLRTSFFESLGAVIKPSDKPLVVYMDHQVSTRLVQIGRFRSSQLLIIIPRAKADV